ncbi:MAG: nitroreductase/quinone reductase family protein [Actinoplanes sp.]
MTDSGFDFNAFQRQIIAEFRANRGRVGGPFEGATLALLTSIGARTGVARTSPLAYLTVDGTPVVVASAMGADKNPDWYHNVLRNPVVTVETGTEKYDAIAAAPTGAERDRLFAAVVALDPGFGDYQKKTARRIPVVTLTRIDTSAVTWSRGLGDFLAEAHAWLRGDLDRLRRQVADGEQPSPVRQHCLDFCSALDRHHTGEGRGAFPMLAQRFPALAPVLERLGEEHRQLRQRLLELEQSDPDLDKLDELADQLDAHFRYEERTIVAALNTLGPAPEFG